MPARTPPKAPGGKKAATSAAKPFDPSKHIYRSPNPIVKSKNASGYGKTGGPRFKLHVPVYQHGDNQGKHRDDDKDDGHVTRTLTKTKTRRP